MTAASPRAALAVASDHAGLEEKNRIAARLAEAGVACDDLGVHAPESVDYPCVARKMAEAILAGTYARGILVCGTGLGMSMAANRFRGIRAALCYNTDVARLARDHNDANILVLPGREPTEDPVDEIVDTWLETPFCGEERHLRRLALMDK